MKKRYSVFIQLLVLLLMAAPALAETRFEDDLHYFSIIPEQPGAEGDRVQVIGFFWYACPHCYSLEPHLAKWLEKKPENIDFVRIPAMFNRPNVIMHAETYYALMLMGVDEGIHEKIFQAIHTDRRHLNTQPDMEELLEENGIDVAAYRQVMKSFAVRTQARRAAVLARRFEITGVPAIVVDGKYRTGGLEGGLMMEVTDYLIDRVRQEKGVN
jgi:thiol:disulfide interchange protein DsbA